MRREINVDSKKIKCIHNVPDGFAFLDLYSRLPETGQQNCIVMILSTSLNPGDHERAKRNKYVRKFLNKPLSKEKLETILNDVVSL